MARKIELDPRILKFQHRTVKTNGADRTSRQRWHVIWKGVLPPGKGGLLLDAGSGEHVWSTTDYEKVVRLDNWQTYVNRDTPPPVGTIDVDLNQEPWENEVGEGVQSKSAEGLLAIDVIEHLENPWAFLREAFRVSKRFVIITTPNTQSVLSKGMFRLNGRFWGFVPDEVRLSGHITPIFTWQLHEAAKRAGWKVDVLTYSNEPFPKGAYIPKELKKLALKKPSQKNIIVRFTPK